MSKHLPTSCFTDNDDEAFVLHRVMKLSWFLVAGMAAGSWLLVDWNFAQSLLCGGVLVNGSFWLMKKDAQRLMQRVSAADAGLAINTEKTRFFLRSVARLVVLGLLLFVVAARYPINVVGLTLGCTTIMVSVVIIGLSAGKCWLPNKV